MANFSRAGNVITITLTADETDAADFAQSKYGALVLRDFFDKWMSTIRAARKATRFEARMNAYENAPQNVRQQVDTLLGVTS